MLRCSFNGEEDERRTGVGAEVGLTDSGGNCDIEGTSGMGMEVGRYC